MFFKAAAEHFQKILLIIVQMWLFHAEHSNWSMAYKIHYEMLYNCWIWTLFIINYCLWGPCYLSQSSMSSGSSLFLILPMRLEMLLTPVVNDFFTVLGVSLLPVRGRGAALMEPREDKPESLAAHTMAPPASRPVTPPPWLMSSDECTSLCCRPPADTANRDYCFRITWQS